MMIAIEVAALVAQGIYQGINTMLLNLETCTAYDFQRFDVFVYGNNPNGAASASALVSYIDSLDEQVWFVIVTPRN